MRGSRPKIAANAIDPEPAEHDRRVGDGVETSVAEEAEVAGELRPQEHDVRDERDGDTADEPRERPEDRLAGGEVGLVGVLSASARLAHERTSRRVPWVQETPCRSAADALWAHPEIAGSAAFDRAEYSLQQGSIVIALVVGGTALAGVGALRLRNAGFLAMPRARRVDRPGLPGLAVVGFGVVAHRDRPPDGRHHGHGADAARDARAPSGGGRRPHRRDRHQAYAEPSSRATTTRSRGRHGHARPAVHGGGQSIRCARRTDAEGRFAFDDVAVDPGSPWVAEATFDGARFPSEVLRAPRSKDRSAALVVAPTTKKANDVEIELESLAIVGDRSADKPSTRVTVVNHGERAYVGGLRLPLLPGATAIQEGTGLDRRYLALGDDTMTSSAPILPGRHDLTYTYIVQMSQRRHRGRTPHAAAPPTATSCSSATGSHCGARPAA